MQGDASQKVCFVTIGATASFDSLLRAAVHPSFLDALKECGYTDLRLQYGKTGKGILQEAKRQKISGLELTGFDFNKQGLGAEMRAAKGEDGRVEGVVISHAGSLAQRLYGFGA